MRVSIRFGTLVSALVMTSSGVALADDHHGGAREAQLSVSLMGGVGAQLGDRDEGALGPGMGLRAGYTIERLYLGIEALLFGARFDTVPTFSDGSSGPDTRLTDGFALGMEGGYAQPLGPIIVRPSVALGVGLLGYVTMGAGAPTLDFGQPRFAPALYVAPGASLLVPIGEFFAGVDPRFRYMLGEQSHSSVSLMGMVGATL